MSNWTDGQLEAIQAQLARVKRSIERYDDVRVLEREASELSRLYYGREVAADEPEADDLWDDAQDSERFARGLGFDSYSDYELNAAEAFEASHRYAE